MAAQKSKSIGLYFQAAHVIIGLDYSESSPDKKKKTI